MIEPSQNTELNDTDRSSIRALVRQFDRERYRAALFAPQPLQDHLLSLFAFNIELSRIPEQVSDPTLGEIRLQWWRDALSEAASGRRTGHPVADALALARRRCLLPDDQIYGMIGARSFDVAGAPMPDVFALEDYLGKSAGAVFLLGAYILGWRSEAASRIAMAGGIAFGLAGLLRALPVHAARGVLFLPADRFVANGVKLQDIFAGEEGEALGPPLAELRDHALARLREAAAEFAVVPPQARPAFLPLATVRPVLQRLEHGSHRPLHDVVQLNPLGSFWRMWRTQMSGRL